MIRGPDLVSTGPEPVVILRGTSWEAARSSAEVRHPVEIVRAGPGGPGAVVLIENRRTAVVGVRIRNGGEPEFATALEAPPGVRVEMAPGGSAMLLISEDDRYLPEASAYRLNRGIKHLDLAGLRWHASIEAALERSRRDDRWYTRAGERYVPEGPIRVTVPEWRGSRCRVRVLPRDGEARILTFS